MTEQWAKKHPEIKFFTMHPGWADTPAVQTSMPDFHARLKDRLRSPEQGADTVVWLGISTAALEEKSGGFYLGKFSFPYPPPSSLSEWGTLICSPYPIFS